MVESKATTPIEAITSSRRQFLQGALTLGVAFAVAEATEDILPKKGPLFGYFERIDKKTKEQLLQFSPVTIAHTGGNSISHLEMSKIAGVDFVEADIKSYQGRLSVTHGENLKTQLLDIGGRLFGLGSSVPLVADLVETSISNNQRLFLDLKEESIDDNNTIARIVEKYGIEDKVVYSGEWMALDGIAQITQSGDNLFYSIDNEQLLYRFLDEQKSRHGLGVSLSFILARADIIKALRAHEVSRVFVYGADYSYEIIPVLAAGADGVITGNLEVLEVWQNQKFERFWVQKEITANRAA